MKIYQNSLYIVEENDSLDKIAEKFKINPTTLLIANNISPKSIRKGFVLFIPNV